MFFRHFRDFRKMDSTALAEARNQGSSRRCVGETRAAEFRLRRALLSHGGATRRRSFGAGG